MTEERPGLRRWQLLVTGGAFAGLALVSFVALGGQAWHPTDYEYVPSQAWRLFHGEVPYRDFIYHKPPGTLLLHWVWFLLPDALEVRASRLCFYVQMVSATAVPTLWALRRGVVPFGWRLPLLGLATTAIALHNFPAMPWQTSDGLCFAALGWTAFLESTVAGGRRAGVMRALASTGLALALVCKQSFIVSCAAFGIYAVVDLVRGLRRGVPERRELFLEAAASAIPAVVVLGAVFAWLVTTGAWPQFVAQFRSQSTGRALGFHLWHIYRGEYRGGWVFALWMLVPWLRVLDGPGWRRQVAVGLAVLPLAWMARSAYGVVENPQWELGGKLGVALGGLLLGEALLALASRRAASEHPLRSAYRPRVLLVGLGVLTLALSCQLSLGYNSPILGLGLLGLLLHAVLPEERVSGIESAPALVASALICAAMWRVNQDNPYRDESRSKLTADLGEVFVKLSGVKTTPANLERYRALRRLVTEQILPTGRPFVALQDYPGINWLFGTRNPISIDWCYPPEPDGFEPRLIEELERSDAIAIIPKEHNARWGEASMASETPCAELKLEGYNDISYYVVKRWRLVGEDRYFCLFRR